MHEPRAHISSHRASGGAGTRPVHPCRIFQTRTRGASGVRILSKRWEAPRRSRYLGSSRLRPPGTSNEPMMPFIQVNDGRCVTIHSERMKYGVNTREKVASPACGSCNVTLVRPFVCLHCSYSGCWTTGHIRGHLRNTGHLFCEPSKPHPISM